MRRALIAASVLMLCAAVAAASPSRTGPKKPHSAPLERERPGNGAFDGSWVFEVTTTVGACSASASNLLDIKNSRIETIDDAAVSPWGYVDEDGELVGRLTRQEGRVSRIHGRLRGSAGSGAWSSSTDLCGGTWRAHRAPETSRRLEHAGRE